MEVVNSYVLVIPLEIWEHWITLKVMLRWVQDKKLCVRERVHGAVSQAFDGVLCLAWSAKAEAACHLFPTQIERFLFLGSSALMTHFEELVTTTVSAFYLT